MRAYLIKLSYPDGRRQHQAVIAADRVQAVRIALDRGGQVPAGLVCKPITKEIPSCLPPIAA